MTFWTALLVVFAGGALTALAVWAVPVLIVLEGELRGERRRGAVSVGLLMGLVGVHASFDQTGVRMRLLLFRRPSFVFRDRAGPDGERRPQAQEEAPTRPRETAETSQARIPGPAVQDQPRDSEPGRESGVRSPESGPGTQDSGPGTLRPGSGQAQDSGGPARGGMMARVRTVRAYVRRYRPPVTRFLGALWRAFRLRRVTCDLVFGTGDPATTGQVSGVVYAIRPLLGPRVRIGLSPDFLRRTFEGRASFSVSVSLARVTVAAVRLGVTVGGMLGWQYVRRRWSGWRERRRQAVGYSV